MVLIVLIVLVILLFIIGVGENRNSYGSGGNNFIGAAVVVMVLGTFASLLLSELDTDEVVRTKNTPIASLHNRSTVSGSFFLGSGRINEEEYYFAMEKMGDDSYRRISVPVNYSIIIEDDDSEPRIVKRWMKSVGNGWFFPFDVEVPDVETHIVVPKNTVIQEFSVR